MTAEDIEKGVGAVIEAEKEALVRDRYRFNGEGGKERSWVTDCFLWHFRTGKQRLDMQRKLCCSANI